MNMIPGAPNPMMAALGGDPLDELGKIERSLRLRAAANAFLTWTPVSAGNRKKWTWRGCVKRGKLGAAQVLFDGGSAGPLTLIRFEVGDQIGIYVTDAAVIQSELVLTTAVFREPAAFLDVQVAVDTTQATVANRIKVWVNGDLQSLSGLSGTYITLNSDLSINRAAQHALGRYMYSAINYAEMVLSSVAFIDGQALPPTTFAQTHPFTQQWRPKTKAAIRAQVAVGGGPRGGWGGNGFFLPFDDATSLTTLGYDRSQSDTDTTGNNWTANNISLTAGLTYDSLIDTPTNNFCTLNPLANTQTLSNGNLTVNAGSSITASHGTMRLGNGALPTYYELESVVVTSASVAVGFGVVGEHVSPAASYQISAVPFIAGFYASNGQYIMRDNGTNLLASASALPAGTKLQLAIKGNKVWIGKAGVYWDAAGGTTGDPENELNPTITIDANVARFPYIHVANNTAHVNFGQRPFDFTPPSWAKNLNTKNLPRPPIPNTKAGFVKVVGTGAAIEAALAAARASWGGDPYVEWFKRRDVAEGHRLRFSTDAANYLDTSSTAAKAAWPGLVSGGSYVAYAYRLTPTYGMASGTVAHVNGAADTITDGVNRARKAVILHRESAGGGDWYYYHPELTPGYLLYFNSTSAETVDASINTVLSSSFVIAAALPTGTYRWWVLGETDGFLSLTKHTGNASVDGPYCDSKGQAGFGMFKNTTTGNSHLILDTARSPGNLAELKLSPGTAVVENDASLGGAGVNALDFVSGGYKVRSGAGDLNQSGQKIVGVVINDAPARYSNAH